MTKYSTEWFIEKAKRKHGDRYDYSKSVYINATAKVEIICKIHDIFWQDAQSHTNRGSGCPKCKFSKLKKIANSSRKTTENFIKQAIEFHGNTYDYSKTEYISAWKKIIIICSKHGEFEQTPIHHLKSGCNKCGFDNMANKRRDSQEQVISKFKKIHKNTYDYSKVEYTNALSNVVIICKTHGEFEQRVAHHLNGVGCPSCVPQHSRPSIEWLETISKTKGIYIRHALNDGEIKIPKTRYKADGYCEETNTIYEFHGDFWHGNPKVYNQDDIHPRAKKTFGELYQKTLLKEQKIRELGYNLVVIWESEWNERNK